MSFNKYNQRIFVGDFETTVYDGQTDTEVWASACVELYTECVNIFHSIGETFEYLKSLNSNIVIYYHNLKFDGSFWLHYFLSTLKLEHSYEIIDKENNIVVWDKKIKKNSIQYSISEMGQWYSIKVRLDNNRTIEFRDSLKLLPFSVNRIGKSFATKHKKLEMEYKGYRYAGCEITPEEKFYIANDVLVVKEALEIMFNEGHDKLTIGSCCLSEFKKTQGTFYNDLYPDLYEIELPEQHKYKTAGHWLRRAYKGGWCYLVKGKENKIFNKGTTADVNSLYPSMMSSESGNKYPIGKPNFWYGNFIPWEAFSDENQLKYFFVRIRTRFKIKEGYLPFIQIKGTYLYKGTECLETSDIFNKKTGEYTSYKIVDGKKELATVELTLTETDYYLLREHYDLSDFEIIDGCYFDAEIGLFDEYIERYKKIKLESKGAMRELAKLFLNNLYGKMASNTNSSFKIAHIKEDGALGFKTVVEDNKRAGYIAIGAAITSYARNFTIRAAQKNYHGVNSRGFIYADTDSIHCDLEPHEIKGITVHDKNFCCWKLESCWDIGFFSRQKTYIEHVTHEDCNEIDNPYYNVKCAGMSPRCKDLFVMSLNGEYPENTEKYTEEERQFLKKKRNISDFTLGLIVPGKLLAKQIKGGTLLVPTTYEMR